MVTNTGFSIPSGTVEVRINYDKVVELEAATATIVAGMGLSIVAGSNGAQVTPGASGTSVDFYGIALDNRLYDSTYNKQYAFDDAYPIGDMVRVAIKGGGHHAVATAKGTVTAGNDVILVAAPDIGEFVDGVTAGSVAGKALTDATDTTFIIEF